METRTNLLTLSFMSSALFTVGAIAADPTGEPGRSSGLHGSMDALRHLG